MAKGSGGYKQQRKRIEHAEEVINAIPTDEQIQEELFFRVVTERFVQVPEVGALVYRNWRLSLHDGNEEERAQIRREITRRLEKFLKEEGPVIFNELQISSELDRLMKESEKLL